MAINISKRVAARRAKAMKAGTGRFKGMTTARKVMTSEQRRERRERLRYNRSHKADIRRGQLKRKLSLKRNKTLAASTKARQRLMNAINESGKVVNIRVLSPIEPVLARAIRSGDRAKQREIMNKFKASLGIQVKKPAVAANDEQFNAASMNSKSSMVSLSASAHPSYASLVSAKTRPLYGKIKTKIKTLKSALGKQIKEAKTGKRGVGKPMDQFKPIKIATDIEKDRIRLTNTELKMWKDYDTSRKPGQKGRSRSPAAKARNISRLEGYLIIGERNMKDLKEGNMRNINFKFGKPSKYPGRASEKEKVNAFKYRGEKVVGRAASIKSAGERAAVAPKGKRRAIIRKRKVAAAPVATQAAPVAAKRGPGRPVTRTGAAAEARRARARASYRAKTNKDVMSQQLAI